jgi:hypothetical protein
MQPLTSRIPAYILFHFFHGYIYTVAACVIQALTLYMNTNNDTLCTSNPYKYY